MAKPYNLDHATDCALNIGQCGHCSCDQWKRHVEELAQMAKLPPMQVSTSKPNTTYTCHCGWSVSHPDWDTARLDFGAHACPGCPILSCGCKGSVCVSTHNAPPAESTDSLFCPTCLLLKQGRQAPCDCGLDYCHNAYTPKSSPVCFCHGSPHPKGTVGCLHDPEKVAARRALILGTIITINCRGCDEELFLDWHTPADLHSDGVVLAINNAQARHRAAGCEGVIG